MAKEFKKLTLTIDGGNAAFGDTPEEAMSEALRIIIDKVVPFLGGYRLSGYTIDRTPTPSTAVAGTDPDGHPEGLSVSDLNGNTVGRVEVEYETTFDHDAEIDF